MNESFHNCTYMALKLDNNPNILENKQWQRRIQRIRNNNSEIWKQNKVEHYGIDREIQVQGEHKIEVQKLGFGINTQKMKKLVEDIFTNQQSTMETGLMLRMNITGQSKKLKKKNKNSDGRCYFKTNILEVPNILRELKILVIEIQEFESILIIYFFHYNRNGQISHYFSSNHLMVQKIHSLLS